MNENEISRIVVTASIEVHRTLGPGLLESAYEGALAYELRSEGLEVVCQFPIPLVYKGQHIGDGFRADIVVNSAVILELKSIEKILPVHKKQLYTYLSLTDLKLGLLLNFGANLMKEGITRIVNGL